MKVAVIVGRFQVSRLHAAHQQLLTTAISHSDRLLVILGENTDVRVSGRMPLTFEQRKAMIHEVLPRSWADVIPIRDCHDDELWCRELDALIAANTEPDDEIALVGGRDSFLDMYTGTYATRHRFQYGGSDVSGTSLRAELAAAPRHTEDFRAGVIWAKHNRYPAVCPTVDIAIFNTRYCHLLLGRKTDETRYRLVGGFADPTSASYEADAQREAMEEANVTVDFVRYLTSALVDDWRYRREVDKVKTILYAGSTSDTGKAGDDICEVRWFENYDLSQRLNELVMPGHRELVRLALTYGHAMSIS